MFLLLLLISPALYWSWVYADTTPTTVTGNSTLQPFLPLPSMPSLLSLKVRAASANPHMTVLVGYPVIQKVVVGLRYDSTQTTHFTATYTTASTTGTIAFAYNDTFYTHRWWPSVGDARLDDSAFFDACCTASATPAETWVCSSWSMTRTRQGTSSVVTNASNYTSSTFVAAHNLYTVIITSMVVAPALSTAPANERSTTSSQNSASSVVARTTTYPATTTSRAHLTKP